MINLYEEITTSLYTVGKTINDIIGVTITKDKGKINERVIKLNLKKFLEKSRITNYGDGSNGAGEMPDLIKIIGDDWWLEREKVAGVEKFVYKQIPIFDGEEKDFEIAKDNYGRILFIPLDRKVQPEVDIKKVTFAQTIQPKQPQTTIKQPELKKINNIKNRKSNTIAQPELDLETIQQSQQTIYPERIPTYEEYQQQYKAQIEAANKKIDLNKNDQEINAINRRMDDMDSKVEAINSNINSMCDSVNSLIEIVNYLKVYNA